MLSSAPVAYGKIIDWQLMVLILAVIGVLVVVYIVARRVVMSYKAHGESLFLSWAVGLSTGIFIALILVLGSILLSSLLALGQALLLFIFGLI